MRKLLLLSFLVLLVSSLFGATLSGFVSDHTNGERLPFVNVLIKDTDLGTMTNKEGYFVINNIPVGKIEIIVSNIAYKQKIITKIVQDDIDDIFIKVELEKNLIQLEGISVTESKKNKRNKFKAREIQVSNILQTTDDILAAPQIAESDVFRSVQMLPGVSSISDFSSGLYVRGGSQDQNLILLDGIDVYNPTHFGGIFSTFNPDAVDNIELLKGGFPAQYGGRLSSVLNVSNLDGNRKYHQGIARVSLISSSSTIQGPWEIGDNSGSYMASFRRTYLELIQKFLDVPDYYFYDGHAKVNWDASDKDKITAGFYFGKDKLTFDMGGKLLLAWGNETFSLQWIHLFNARIFSHFIIAGSHFGNKFEIASEADESMKYANNIYDITFKSMLTYTPNETHLIEMGWDMKKNNIDMKFLAANSDIDQSAFPNIKVSSYLPSIYIQDSWKINDKITLQPGIRFAFSYAKSPSLPSSPVGKYYRASPRFSFRYKFAQLTDAYFNYGRYYQYLTSMNIGMSTPFDSWFPIDGSVNPGESDHFIIGFSKQFSEVFALDIECYYKKYLNLVEYRPENDYEWSNETGKLSDIYNMGKGFSYGSDIMLRTTWFGFEGFIGYSYGITKRKIDNVNIDPETGDKVWYFPRYDRTHQLNIMETFKYSDYFGRKVLGSLFQIGFNFSLSSGQPYQIPEQLYVNQDNLQILYSYSDHIRLPNYSRFDISFKFKWQFHSWSIEPYLQLINAFNHKNIWTVGYSFSVDEDGIVQIEQDESTMFPFIPFIGFSVEW